MTEKSENTPATAPDVVTSEVIPLTSPAPKAKPSKKKPQAKRHSGQSGPPIDLPLDRMSASESKIIEAFRAHKGAEISISELAAVCFPTLANTQANSTVRNALRRIVRGGWLAKADRGAYKLTPMGKRRLSKVA